MFHPELLSVLNEYLYFYREQITPEVFLRTVTCAVQENHLKEKIKNLRVSPEKILTDEITGLHNVIIFRDRLLQMVSVHRHWPRPIAVALVEVETLSNETHNQWILREVAKRISSCLSLQVV